MITLHPAIMLLGSQVHIKKPNLGIPAKTEAKISVRSHRQPPDMSEQPIDDSSFRLHVALVDEWNKDKLSLLSPVQISNLWAKEM